MRYILEGEDNSVALRVRLLVNLDFAVYHGHNTVAELEIDYQHLHTNRLVQKIPSHG